MSGPNELVRIRSTQELRAGLAIMLKPCMICNKSHWLNLLLEVHEGACSAHDVGEDTTCPPRMVWTVLGCKNDEPSCFGDALASGRMWRFRLISPGIKTSERLAMKKSAQ